ncbi:hypothetical protein [Falsiroseomonas sp.]|uniref:hypothetical protein n=1 Tax=Falsiroseomonas sp. TaxID=2870721 RepID=UPI003F6EDC37
MKNSTAAQRRRSASPERPSETSPGAVLAALSERQWGLVEDAATALADQAAEARDPVVWPGHLAA